MYEPAHDAEVARGSLLQADRPRRPGRQLLHHQARPRRVLVEVVRLLPDGTVEALWDPARLPGVQWHAEFLAPGRAERACSAASCIAACGMEPQLALVA